MKKNKSYIIKIIIVLVIFIIIEYFRFGYIRADTARELQNKDRFITMEERVTELENRVTELESKIE